MLVVIVIAVVILAAFWKTFLRFIIAALVIGFIFLCVSGALDIAHGLHALIP